MPSQRIVSLRNGFIAAFFSCIALAVSQTNGQPPQASITTSFGTDGDDLYEAACAACHGADGRGLTASQLGFELAVPDFTDCDFAAREPDSDWLAVIHEGGPARGFDRKMPAFGEALSDDEIQRTLDHVRTQCADTNWPRGELNVPKALFTEKAFPEDEAIVRTSIDTEGADAITQRFTWEQRFGPRSQIEISLPWTRTDLGEPAGTESGIGDLTLALKHAIRHSLETQSILSIGGELVLPTGDEDRGFGKGTAVLEPYLLYAKLLPQDSFVQFQGKLELPVESGFDEELVLRAAFGRTWTSGGRFGRAWTPIVEVLGAKTLSGGGAAQWDLVPQFQVTLNVRQHVMANFGVRVPVTDTSVRDKQLVFYLLWDWFDGGLTEGW
jgi:mono/diheme cytochrome c family protein